MASVAPVPQAGNLVLFRHGDDELQRARITHGHVGIDHPHGNARILHGVLGEFTVIGRIDDIQQFDTVRSTPHDLLLANTEIRVADAGVEVQFPQEFLLRAVFRLLPIVAVRGNRQRIGGKLEFGVHAALLAHIPIDEGAGGDFGFHHVAAVVPLARVAARGPGADGFTPGREHGCFVLQIAGIVPFRAGSPGPGRGHRQGHRLAEKSFLGHHYNPSASLYVMCCVDILWNKDRCGLRATILIP